MQAAQTMTTGDQDRMTVPEAASAFGVSDETIRSWIRRGKIRGFKRAGVVRVAPSDIERYLTEVPIVPRDAAGDATARG